MSTPANVGLLLSDDLIFVSRITGAAQAHQLEITPAGKLDKLQALARERPPACVLVDLTFPQLDVAGLVAWLRENLPAMPRLVAFGPHVEAAQLRAARQAGCDEVYPRSKFAELLPTAVVGWLQPPVSG